VRFEEPALEVKGATIERLSHSASEDSAVRGCIPDSAHASGKSSLDNTNWIRNLKIRN
jgi:hypothetical protein